MILLLIKLTLKLNQYYNIKYQKYWQNVTTKLADILSKEQRVMLLHHKIKFVAKQSFLTNLFQ